MRFTPKSEDEAQPPVLPSGEYDALVGTATDKVSKSDNDMIELVLTVWDHDGNETKVFDYLLEKIPLKLRHFCIAAGIEDAYNAGELTAELCQGHNVCVKLKIDEGKGEWPRSNKVVGYIAPATTTRPAPAPAPAPAPSPNPSEPGQAGPDADNPF